MSDATAASDDELTTYVVERYWPGVTEDLLAAALTRASAASARLNTRVDHLESVLIASEEVVFCLFRASSAESVRDANRAAGAPFERVVEATVVSMPASVPRGRRDG